MSIKILLIALIGTLIIVALPNAIAIMVCYSLVLITLALPGSNPKLKLGSTKKIKLINKGIILKNKIVLLSVFICVLSIIVVAFVNF